MTTRLRLGLSLLCLVRAAVAHLSPSSDAAPPSLPRANEVITHLVGAGHFPTASRLAPLPADLPRVAFPAAALSTFRRSSLFAWGAPKRSPGCCGLAAAHLPYPPSWALAQALGAGAQAPIDALYLENAYRPLEVGGDPLRGGGDTGPSSVYSRAPPLGHPRATFARGLPIDAVRQMAVREAFVHAWSRGYVAHAWGHDTLRPLSRTSDDAFGSVAMSAVDSLDTLLLLGLHDEYERAEALVLRKTRLSSQEGVNVFEFTIRVLGGLLSAFELTNRTRPALLTRAASIADALVPAFESPSGIPFGTFGMRSRLTYNPPWVPGSTTAEVMSLQLEWEHLSALTGNPKYALLARRALSAVVGVEPIDSLLPQFLDPHTGLWAAAGAHASFVATLGGRVDSAYEYLLKYHLLAGGTRDTRVWLSVHDASGRDTLETGAGGGGVDAGGAPSSGLVLSYPGLVGNPSLLHVNASWGRGKVSTAQLFPRQGTPVAGAWSALLRAAHKEQALLSNNTSAGMPSSLLLPPANPSDARPTFVSGGVTSTGSLSSPLGDRRGGVLEAYAAYERAAAAALDVLVDPVRNTATEDERECSEGMGFVDGACAAGALASLSFHPMAHGMPGPVCQASEASWFTASYGAWLRAAAGIEHVLVRTTPMLSASPATTWSQDVDTVDGEDVSSDASLSQARLLAHVRDLGNDGSDAWGELDEGGGGASTPDSGGDTPSSSVWDEGHMSAAAAARSAVASRGNASAWSELATEWSVPLLAAEGGGYAFPSERVGAMEIWAVSPTAAAAAAATVASGGGSASAAAIAKLGAAARREAQAALQSRVTAAVKLAESAEASLKASVAALGSSFALSSDNAGGNTKGVMPGGGSSAVRLGMPQGHEAKLDHLACFAPGLFALSSASAPTPNLAARHLALARKLMRTCVRLYTVTASGVAPEMSRFPEGSADPVPDPGSRHSLLRPEVMESLFLLYRVTGDGLYREWGWRIFTALETTSRVPWGGHAGLRDTTAPFNTSAPFSPSLHTDSSMDSFWLSETLKYAYLLFGDEHVLPLDEFVFNTEAHPFRVWPPVTETEAPLHASPAKKGGARKG